MENVANLAGENIPMDQALSSTMETIRSIRINIAALKEQNRHLLEAAQRPEHQVDITTSSDISDILLVSNWGEIGQSWQKMSEELSITKENIEKMLFTVSCTEQLLQRWMQIFERTIHQK